MIGDYVVSINGETDWGKMAVQVKTSLQLDLQVARWMLPGTDGVRPPTSPTVEPNSRRSMAAVPKESSVRHDFPEGMSRRSVVGVGDSRSAEGSHAASPLSSSSAEQESFLAPVQESAPRGTPPPSSDHDMIPAVLPPGGQEKSKTADPDCLVIRIPNSFTGLYRQLLATLDENQNLFGVRVDCALVPAEGPHVGAAARQDAAGGTSTSMGNKIEYQWRNRKADFDLAGGGEEELFFREKRRIMSAVGGGFHAVFGGAAGEG